ncbi:MAG TPA: META domain-containing protein [Thermoanaerobaculia bacterium]|nr:META domain-containing protein [Thermoanaerobaculia bacterium]
MNESRNALLALTLLALAAASAARAGDPAGAPTPEELAGATYTGIEETAITLTDGAWEGAPYDEGSASRPMVRLTGAGDFLLAGDLDGDGAEEAVVHLVEDGGGTGRFGYLVVMARGANGLVQKGIAELGARVVVRGGRIAEGGIVLDVIQGGPGDAACCPGQLATRTFTLADGVLDEVASEVTGAVSAALLEGREWVLRGFDEDDPAPAEPEATIVFEGGRLGGSNGCNRYNAGFETGELPTQITIGPVMATRRACEPAATELEQRFDRALAGVDSWSLSFDRLTLLYKDGEEWRRMSFVGRELPGQE